MEEQSHFSYPMPEWQVELEQRIRRLDLTPQEKQDLEQKIHRKIRYLELTFPYVVKSHVDAFIDEHKKYTFADVLKHPGKSAINEIFLDMRQYAQLFSGKTPFRQGIKADLATILSFGFFSVPHELIHAGVNKLTGRGNEEIVINKLFLGDLYHWLSPSIESKLMLPFIGGYVKPVETSLDFSHVICLLAPYVLTPVGIYLMAEAKKKKSLPYAIAGSGLVASHLGGIIGDFFNAGYTLVHRTGEAVFTHLGYTLETYKHNGFFQLATIIGGFYLGTKIMSFTYRLSKAGVNYVRKKFTAQSTQNAS